MSLKHSALQEQASNTRMTFHLNNLSFIQFYDKNAEFPVLQYSAWDNKTVPKEQKEYWHLVIIDFIIEFFAVIYVS